MKSTIPDRQELHYLAGAVQNDLKPLRSRTVFKPPSTH